MAIRDAAAPAASMLLAGAAGVVDLWAVSALGGPFAGVVTGNLVVVGGELGRGDLAGLWPPLVAVGGFAVGAALWSFGWRRRPRALLAPLAVELGVLVALAVGWALVAGTPTLALLGGAALAMGAQSSTALRLGESTTYLTGTLTGALTALVAGGEARRIASLRQLAALVAGAVVAAVLLGVARWSVPVLALVLVAAATGVLATRSRYPARS